MRVASHSYFACLLLGSFISAYLFYLGIDIAGAILLAVSWFLVPFLALNDRISFNGKNLSRTGWVPRIWTWLNAARGRLRIKDIEQVETQAIRSLKRGGNIFYRYQTIIRGKSTVFTISSGGERYRKLVKSVLSCLPDSVLDNRSIELRDHLADPREILRRADFARIPSVDVLESSDSAAGIRGRRTNTASYIQSDEEKESLQSLANELRLSGYLVQSLEAFRRALILKPADARLLFEFARCLHSFARVKHDDRLERRAIAALRLSERRAANDGELLARLGEWYFQIGEWKRAGSTFQYISEKVGENFRSARGMAEIALREGKIAHVIHHFSNAVRIAETPSLRRWSKCETDYFTHLNSDEEYMELEIGRINMLETVDNSRRTSLRIALFAMPLIIIGVSFDDALVANIGWAIASLSLFVWTALIFGARLLGQRIPYDLVESDD